VCCDAAQRRAIAAQQGVLAVARGIEDQHRLIVGPSVVEQNFNASEIIDGEFGPRNGLFDQVPGALRAEGALTQDHGLNPGLGTVGRLIENLARHTYVPALDHHAREYGEKLKQFVKHAPGPKSGPPRAALTQ